MFSLLMFRYKYLLSEILPADTILISKNTDFFVLPQILTQNQDFLDVTLISID